MIYCSSIAEATESAEQFCSTHVDWGTTIQPMWDNVRLAMRWVVIVFRL